MPTRGRASERFSYRPTVTLINVDPSDAGEMLSQEVDEPLGLRRQKTGFGQCIDGYRGGLPLWQHTT